MLPLGLELELLREESSLPKVGAAGAGPRSMLTAGFQTPFFCCLSTSSLLRPAPSASASCCSFCRQLFWASASRVESSMVALQKSAPSGSSLDVGVGRAGAGGRSPGRLLRGSQGVAVPGPWSILS
eukprot:scaffold535828_cov25-Prasinocladus_malaysianus.AAC.2